VLLVLNAWPSRPAHRELADTTGTVRTPAIARADPRPTRHWPGSSRSVRLVRSGGCPEETTAGVGVHGLFPPRLVVDETAGAVQVRCVAALSTVARACARRVSPSDVIRPSHYRRTSLAHACAARSPQWSSSSAEDPRPHPRRRHPRNRPAGGECRDLGPRHWARGAGSSRRVRVAPVNARVALHRRYREVSTSWCPAEERRGRTRSVWA
jgi:hypothetical protein